MGSWEFRATSAGWVAHLDGVERAAVLDVVDDVVELLAADDTGGTQLTFGLTFGTGGVFGVGEPFDTRETSDPGERFGAEDVHGAEGAPGAGAEPDADPTFGAEVPGATWPGVRIDEGTVAAPSDPALRRLLPDGSRGAPEVAAEFRRLTESELRGTKAGNLEVLRSLLAADGPDLRVDPSAAPAVAAALTDLRLVLAERLGIRSESDADAVYRLVVEGGPLDVTDPDGVARRFLATVSTLLGVLQESLVELMLEGLGGDEAPGPSGVGEDRHDGSDGPPAGDPR